MTITFFFFFFISTCCCCCLRGSSSPLFWLCLLLLDLDDSRFLVGVFFFFFFCVSFFFAAAAAPAAAEADSVATSWRTIAPACSASTKRCVMCVSRSCAISMCGCCCRRAAHVRQASMKPGAHSTSAKMGSSCLLKPRCLVPSTLPM